MRNTYFDQLDSIVDELVDMTREVKVAVARATQALLTADAEVAEKVISDDAAIDSARERVEERSFELLALQQPVASDLERMGDLSVHVAKIARLRVPQVAVPAEIVPTIERMATVAEKMVDTVAGIIAERDVEGARQLEEDDEEMDQLRRSSFRLMLDDSWPHGVEPAVDIALLGRYYERIADHAVSLARRVVYLVTGETVTTVDHL
jgi:phosphate transport system protein